MSEAWRTYWELSSLGWGCRIHQLHLCRRVNPPSNDCPDNDSKQSDGEAPVMLEHWEIQSTSSLPSLPVPLSPGEVAPDRVLSMGQIKLTFKLCANK